MGITNRTAKKVGVAMAKKVIDASENAAESYFTGKTFYPEGKTAAKAHFGGHITLDRELGRQMFNACGYEPNNERVLKELYDTAACSHECGQSF